MSGGGLGTQPNTEPTGVPTVTTGTTATKTPMTDKRSSQKILNQPTDYSKNANRLSNVRWPLGQEPYHDVEGTGDDDNVVNVKLEVVENPDPDPNQRHLLGGGPELKIPCFTCGAKMHIGAAKTSREVLEEGGYKLKGEVDNADMRLLACVCTNGHLLQLREDAAQGLIKRD